MVFRQQCQAHHPPPWADDTQFALMFGSGYAGLGSGLLTASPLTVRYNPAMRALLVVVVAVALRSLAVAQDAAWPQSRGPNAGGVAASDATPPLEFSPSKHMLWKLPVPQGHSSPTV
jgi:hypothetical protein